ncbi:hypothetical protein B0H12DRAFT_1231128 [Mycena haematopus]|nr:hypothetical protein B0H12DRAFT_1231128 [Mycena haematopus]
MLVFCVTRAEKQHIFLVSNRILHGVLRCSPACSKSPAPAVSNCPPHPTTQPMPTRVRISEALQTALAQTNQIRHHLVYGDPEAREAYAGTGAVGAWASYFSTYTELLDLSWLGTADEERVATLTRRVQALRILAIALEAQGDNTASSRYQSL